jgi:hypothetical protein
MKVLWLGCVIAVVTLGATSAAYADKCGDALNCDKYCFHIPLISKRYCTSGLYESCIVALATCRALDNRKLRQRRFTPVPVFKAPVKKTAG